MIALSIAEIAAATGGRIVRPQDSSVVVAGTVHTDSRLVVAGDTFFAMPGEVTDGHLFAPAAVASGAALVVAEHELDLDVPQIIVEQGVVALGLLAAAVVARVRALGRLKVVGITGSNGKTTTKNMLRAICSAVGATVAPEGSFNNQVGAPISMLGLTEASEYLIIEMGASGRGEIAKLVAMAMPDISVVLKVGLAHAGEFGGIEQTFIAKSEIVTALPPTAVAVLNADDSRVAQMAGLTQARVRWFGTDAPDAPDAVAATGITVSASGTDFLLTIGESAARPVHLRILGEHHVTNALAALTVADELGIDADVAITAIEGLVRAERWRMELLDPGNGIIVINDAYNASPDSMAAAMKTLAQIVTPEQRSVAVLGEMAELGEYAQEEHDRIGRLAVRLNVGKLVVVGWGARHINAAAGLEGSWDGESVYVETIDEAYAVLHDELRSGDVVLVKSSKSANLRFLGDRIGGLS